MSTSSGRSSSSFSSSTYVNRVYMVPDESATDRILATELATFNIADWPGCSKEEHLSQCDVVIERHLNDYRFLPQLSPYPVVTSLSATYDRCCRFFRMLCRMNDEGRHPILLSELIAGIELINTEERLLWEKVEEHLEEKFVAVRRAEIDYFCRRKVERCLAFLPHDGMNYYVVLELSNVVPLKRTMYAHERFVIVNVTATKHEARLFRRIIDYVDTCIIEGCYYPAWYRGYMESIHTNRPHPVDFAGNRPRPPDLPLRMDRKVVLIDSGDSESELSETGTDETEYTNVVKMPKRKHKKKKKGKKGKK